MFQALVYFPKYVCGAQYGSFFFAVFYFMPSLKLLRHFVKYFAVDPVTLIITGTSSVFTFRMLYISIVMCSVHIKSSPLDKSLGAQRWRKV
jgi:hypothetical protein